MQDALFPLIVHRPTTREVADRVKDGGVSALTEAERRARTLASLARTLGEVTRLRAGQHKVNPADDDAVPRDLDEFRRALSRRLEQLVAAPAPDSAGEHE